MDKATTNFPKVGTGVATPRNTSGSPSTKAVPKQGPRGGAVDEILVRGRQNVIERMGATYVPSSTWKPSDHLGEEATLRNVRLLKPAKGYSDFYASRAQYGQGV